MIATDIPFEFSPDPDSSKGRSPGLHLGEVVREYGVATGQVKLVSEARNTKELHFAKGFLWERIFTHVWGQMEAEKYRNRENYLSQPELQVDGIFMTPDGVDLEGDCLDEFKATTRSINKFDNLEAHFDLWLVQIMGYLYGLQMTKCRLIVLFLCGDYKPPFPEVRAKQLVFTQRELDENWRLIMNYARRMR